jgi:thiol-disulfide isomerase/thioredoxin
MRKFVTALLLSFFPFCVVFGQNAILHISLANGKTTSWYVNMPGYPTDGFYRITSKGEHTASYSFKLISPEFVQLNCFDSDDWEHKHFNYLLYLSPGDDLEFNADFNEPEFGIKVTGKGSNNNQPLMSAMETADLYRFRKDTLPNRVISTINAAQKVRENNLEKYIKLYKPSTSYFNDWKLNLRYYACDLYYGFKEDNKNYVWEAYYRNYNKWKDIADSLFNAVKLNSDTALTTFHYVQLVRTFLVREKDNFSDEAYLHPEAFYREWYHADTVEGKKQFNADRKNLVREKIINKYFTGKTAEYLYVILLDGAVQESNPQNIPEIFGCFKRKYPNSEYMAQFSRSVDTIIANQKHTLNERMVFMADNGTKFNTLDEVLVAMKGKMVLVDMWGTWCGPCREEIEKNSAAIRHHFKNKGLTYLYIANYDIENGEQWKKLIVYFDMEGTHLLANKKLTDDIMKKVKGRGFPTVFIIKKDGSFELSKTEYPIKKDILIKQLEEALAQ